MALGSQPRWTTRPADTVVGIDAGLREYMLRVYNYMASGLALTGIVAYVAAESGFYASIAKTPLIWLVILAPLGLVMLMSFGIQRMQARTAQMVEGRIAFGEFVCRPRLRRIGPPWRFHLLCRGAPALRGLSDCSVAGRGLHRLCDPRPHRRQLHASR